MSGAAQPGRPGTPGPAQLPSPASEPLSANSPTGTPALQQEGGESQPCVPGRPGGLRKPGPPRGTPGGGGEGPQDGAAALPCLGPRDLELQGWGVGGAGWGGVGAEVGGGWGAGGGAAGPGRLSRRKVSISLLRFACCPAVLSNCCMLFIGRGGFCWASRNKRALLARRRGWGRPGSGSGVAAGPAPRRPASGRRWRSLEDALALAALGDRVRGPLPTSPSARRDRRRLARGAGSLLCPLAVLCPTGLAGWHVNGRDVLLPFQGPPEGPSHEDIGVSGRVQTPALPPPPSPPREGKRPWQNLGLPRVWESRLQLEGARSPRAARSQTGRRRVTGRGPVPCARPCAHSPHLQEKRHFHLHLSNPPQSVAARDARGPESPWTLTLLLQLVSQGERRPGSGVPGRPGSQSEPGCWAWEPGYPAWSSGQE